MISFLTNEKMPKRLQHTLKSLKQKEEKEIQPKKDKLLFILGASFLTGMFVLFVLLVLSVFFLY